MKVSELIETLEPSGIIKRACIGFLDSVEFTGPDNISEIKTDPAYTVYRISDVKVWLVDPGEYETILWIYI